MEKLVSLLEQGEDYFGSGGRNTPEFNSFFTAFKRELTKELKAEGATKIELGKGHFYLSGFFTTESGQIVYISLSDVRHNFGGGEPRLLYRTAKHYRDFTGGSNRYQTIRKGMAQQMVKNVSVSLYN